MISAKPTGVQHVRTIVRFVDDKETRDETRTDLDLEYAGCVDDIHQWNVTTELDFDPTTDRIQVAVFPARTSISLPLLGGASMRNGAA